MASPIHSRVAKRRHCSSSAWRRDWLKSLSDYRRMRACSVTSQADVGAEEGCDRAQLTTCAHCSSACCAENKWVLLIAVPSRGDGSPRLLWECRGDLATEACPAMAAQACRADDEGCCSARRIGGVTSSFAIQSTRRLQRCRQVVCDPEPIELLCLVALAAPLLQPRRSGSVLWPHRSTARRSGACVGWGCHSTNSCSTQMAWASPSLCIHSDDAWWPCLIVLIAGEPKNCSSCLINHVGDSHQGCTGGCQAALLLFSSLELMPPPSSGIIRELFLADVVAQPSGVHRRG